MDKLNKIGVDVFQNIQQANKRLNNKLNNANARNQKLSFNETLKASINKVNKLQQEADKAVQDLVTGETKDIHQTMIALKKADVSLQLMIQVRNKIVDAYQEIMRMAV